MKAWTIRISLVVAALMAVCVADVARAQAPLEPAQMSPRTLFYLIWRGVPSPDARKANALLALWDDADFAPVRSAMVAGMLGSSDEKSTQPKLTPEQVQEFAGLLENSFTLGYWSEPTRRNLSNGAAVTEAKVPAWNGMFFVYDRTGKEMLLTKAVLRMRAEEKEAPRLSQVAIAGVQVLKAEGKGGATYWAEHGKFAVSAGEKLVMEDLLSRLDGKISGGASLVQSAAYQEAQANLSGGLLEFFLRIPDLKNLANDSKAGMFQIRPLLDAARLDAVHSIGGHVTFEGAKTHVQAAILGEAVSGTLFDIWSTGQQSPASLAFAPVNAVSYTSAQVNFQGIYDTLKRVAGAAFPQTHQGNVDLIDAMAQQKLGMPVADALGLLSGEFASMQTSPSLDTAKQVYFFGIRKKPETLKLMRTVFSDQITSERNEGDVTFVKISLGGKKASEGVAQWNFFNLAVTPDMILGASKMETLREALERRTGGTTGAGLASVPQFAAGRQQFPEKLIGLSYFDFQRVDWAAARDRWVAESKKSSVVKSMNSSTPSTAMANANEWLQQMNPQVISRHLHRSLSVSWKDSKGIHWDQWVE
ncbi:MAG: hypothetical protein AUI12_04505 [Acidobacteria bacterium 13_2_20CM_2_57_6]|jgi:hypothetical protein|nr:MAG: hypothetical protein AUI12_04505 [Acidobacteria bacterium 13_2_20CM_2_57_6]PYT40689.1 MAG: hypothetical protein DMG45_15920 [Acidobacteriota bacterium]PYT45793.1 MAG: hypothetical protein DMG47_07120 [Acidobacteriota bacterium]